MVNISLKKLNFSEIIKKDFSKAIEKLSIFASLKFLKTTLENYKKKKKFNNQLEYTVV